MLLGAPQGKLHDTLEEHLGQLAAEMKSAREQYMRTCLGKRKHDNEGMFMKVSSMARVVHQACVRHMGNSRALSSCCGKGRLQ